MSGGGKCQHFEGGGLPAMLTFGSGARRGSRHSSFSSRADRPDAFYLRAAQAYILISMPTGTSTIFGAFQVIRASHALWRVVRDHEGKTGLDITQVVTLTCNARVWLISACLIARPCPCALAAELSITPASMVRIGTVDERFQSCNVEMIEVTGGRFWKPYGPTAPDGHSDLYGYRPPTDFTNPRLRTLAAVGFDLSHSSLLFGVSISVPISAWGSSGRSSVIVT